MALQADKDGFLVGTPITLDKVAASRAVSVWKAIKDDTSAIRKAVSNRDVDRARMRTALPVRAANQSLLTDRQVDRLAARIVGGGGATKTERKGVALPARDERGRFVASGRADDGRASAQPRSAAAMAAAEPVVSGPSGAALARAEGAAVPKGPAVPERNRNEPKRNDKGQFQKGDGEGQPKGAMGRLLAMLRERLGDGAEAVSQVVSDAVSGTEDVDPAIRASKEIAETVAPLAQVGKGLYKFVVRPSMGLGRWAMGKGRETELGKKTLDVQKRIWKELRSLNRKPASAGGGGGDDGGGLFGGLGMLLMPLLPMIIPALAVAAAGAIGAGIGMWLYNSVGPAIVGAFESAGAWIKEKWTGVTELFGAVADWLKESWQGMKDFGGEVKNTVNGTFANVMERVDSARSYLSDAMKRVTGGGSSANRAALVKQMQADGISDPKEQAMFMANMDHESGGFRNMEESFNYRSADRIMQVSGTASRKGRAAVEAAMAQGPQAVAELMYGGRMGNTSPGDAYKYRGRGFTQLTGKDQYAEAGQALGLDLVNNPDLAADPANAAKIATWYWKNKGASAAGKAGDVTAATKAINGGTNGLAERQALYSAYLGEAQRGGFATPAQPMPSAAGRATPATVTVRASPVPSAAPNVKAMAAPPIPPAQTTLASSDKGKERTVVVQQSPVGQNLNDRSIAQVATGGMGSNGRM